MNMTTNRTIQNINKPFSHCIIRQRLTSCQIMLILRDLWLTDWLTDWLTYTFSQNRELLLDERILRIATSYCSTNEFSESRLSYWVCLWRRRPFDVGRRRRRFSTLNFDDYRSKIHRIMGGNLLRGVAIVFSYSSLVYKPSSSSGFGLSSRQSIS